METKTITLTLEQIEMIEVALDYYADADLEDEELEIIDGISEIIRG
jgi:hypothetical protein